MSFLFGSQSVYAQSYIKLDSAFNIGTGFTGSNDVYVIASEVQSDGKIILGGKFEFYNGESKNNIVRLNFDGSIDTTFKIGIGFDYNVQAIKIQSDNKILVGGGFTKYKGNSHIGLIRLLPNGEIDTSFKIGTGGKDVSTIEITSNNVILIGGSFTTFNGQSRVYFAQLNMDGTLLNTNTNFDDSPTNAIKCIVVQPDNKILVGGQFYYFNSSPARFLIRLNSDYSIDTAFFVSKSYTEGFSSNIRAIKVQNDGKIILGGAFTRYGSINVNHLARLNSDGTIDNDFNIGSGANFDVNSIYIQDDSKIVVGGSFSSFNNQVSKYLIRLLNNGSIDNSFKIGSGFSSYVSSITPLSNETILLTGGFTSYNSISQNRISKLLTGANTNVSEKENFSKCRVIPNPIKNHYLSINVPNLNNKYDVEIFDLIGKTVFKQINISSLEGKLSVDLNCLELKSGVYYTKIKNESIFEIVKFEIIN